MRRRGCGHGGMTKDEIRISITPAGLRGSQRERYYWQLCVSCVVAVVRVDCEIVSVRGPRKDEVKFEFGAERLSPIHLYSTDPKWEVTPTTTNLRISPIRSNCLRDPASHRTRGHHSLQTPLHSLNLSLLSPLRPRLFSRLLSQPSFYGSATSVSAGSLFQPSRNLRTPDLGIIATT